VSEVITCPQCGNEIAPDIEQCPHCGTALQVGMAAPATEPEAVTPSAGGFQATIQAILATTQTHKWYWAGGGGGALVVAVLAVLFFTGVFGPSGRAICTSTLTQAKDFGVISPSATLASSSAKSTDVKNRRQCTAQVGDDTYVLQVDIQAEDTAHKKCTDFTKQTDCVKLYSVARSDGMTTYQVRAIPPDETDEALLGQAPGAAPPGSPPPGAAAPDSGAAEPGGLDSQTAVDNGGVAQSPPASDQAPPQ